MEYPPFVEYWRVLETGTSNGKWVKRRTEKPFDLDHEIQQSLRAIGAT